MPTPGFVFYPVAMSDTFQAVYQPAALQRPGILALSGEISYHEAPQLREALSDAIDRGGPVLIDLGKVETMDTAALAVLVEGLVTTEAQGQELFLCTPSDSVRRIFHLAGLDGALARCWGCVDLASRAVAD